MTEPQLSVSLPTYAVEQQPDWSPVFDLARAADSTGVDRVVMSDHIVFGERLDEYGKPELGGQAGGTQPTGPDGPWLEPMVTLSVLAGMTSRVRLGTNILAAALRRPVVLAKAASTLDVLSGGRLDLGVGVGWQREEYEAAGLPFDGRGRLLDHTLDVLRTLWTEERADHHSDYLDFEAIHQMPKPLQPGGVPVWVSGTINPAVIRRLARFGSGWIPWGPDAEDAAAIARMKQAVADAGRDPAGLQVAGRLPVVRDAAGAVDLDLTMEGVPALVHAGVTDFRAYLKHPVGVSAIEDALAPVVSAFRAVAGRPSPVSETG
ncbi:MAG: TIGR03619 family F420-dependent LLM class oxidoreductase [Actinomycetota bacterium]